MSVSVGLDCRKDFHARSHPIANQAIICGQRIEVDLRPCRTPGKLIFESHVGLTVNHNLRQTEKQDCHRDTERKWPEEQLRLLFSKMFAL